MKVLFALAWLAVSPSPSPSPVDEGWHEWHWVAPSPRPHSMEWSFGWPPVARLVWDVDQALCYWEGDVAEALAVMREALEGVSEERDRLRWGDRQVDEWKRDERARNAEWYELLRRQP